MRSRTWMAIASVLGAAACSDTTYGGGGGGGGCTPTATQVCAQTTAFAPTGLTINMGQTVTWRHASGVGHTVTSATGSTEVFNGAVDVGGTFSRQFNTVGTFPYYCTVHGFNGTPPTGMSGTITVQ
ncbi:MAG: cupredoxin domain-containing protein [Gemmatimonadales bacterium]